MPADAHGYFMADIRPREAGYLVWVDAATHAAERDALRASGGAPPGPPDGLDAYLAEPPDASQMALLVVHRVTPHVTTREFMRFSTKVKS